MFSAKDAPAAKPEASGAKAPPRCNVCGDEVVDCCCSLNTKPRKPAPAPLDPRAVAIYEGAVRLRSGRSTGTLGDCVREAGELLRGAEREAAK